MYMYTSTHNNIINTNGTHVGKFKNWIKNNSSSVGKFINIIPKIACVIEGNTIKAIPDNIVNFARIVNM